ncbi:hypothetical protein K1X59_05335 [Microbacterium sp. Se5.02b]|nr:hypothetical protein K1X59_05335 [Microbacterium sp. Se5.02b]
MIAFLLPLAVFLATVFAASALGKVRSADRGLTAFTALRIPVRHPHTAAVSLIVLEAVMALGLLLTTGWLFVGFSSAALLLCTGLLIAVVRAHRLGSDDDCGCFGEWLPSAVGPRLIVRNAVLTVIALSTLAAALAALGSSLPVGIPAVAGSATAAPVAIGAVGSGLLIATAVWSIVRASGIAAAETDQIPRGAGAVLLPGTAEVVDVLAPGARTTPPVRLSGMPRLRHSHRLARHGGRAAGTVRGRLCHPTAHGGHGGHGLVAQHPGICPLRAGHRGLTRQRARGRTGRPRRRSHRHERFPGRAARARQ